MASVGTVVIDVDADTTKFTEGMKTTNRELYRLNGQVRKATDGIRGMIAGLAGMSIAQQAMTATIDGFKEMELLVLEIQKTTSLSGRELAGLTNSLGELSTSLGGMDIRGLYEIASGAGQLGITGVENINKFTKEIGYMVGSSKLGAEEATLGFAKLGIALNEPVSEINKLTSMMTKLASTTTANEASLLQYSNRLVGMSKTFGLTASEIAGLGATLSDVGIEYEVAGSSMSTLMIKVMKDSEKFAIVSGMAFKDYAKLVKDEPISALESFLNAFGKLDKMKKIDVLDKLGINGIEEINTVMKLSEKTDKLRANIETATEAYADGDATRQEFMVTQNALVKQQEIATSAIKQMQVAIGEGLKPTLIELNSVVADGASYIGDNAEALLKAGGVAVDVAVGIGSLKLAYYALTKAQQLNTAWTVGAGAVGMVGQISRLNALERQIITASVAQRGLNALMRATPWGLAITGTALVGSALHEVFETEKRRAKLASEYASNADERDKADALKEYNKALKDREDNIKAISTLEKAISNDNLNEKAKEALKNNVKLLQEKKSILKESLDYAKDSLEFEGYELSKLDKVKKEVKAVSSIKVKANKDVVKALEEADKNQKEREKALHSTRVAHNRELASLQSKLDTEKINTLKRFTEEYNRATRSDTAYKLIKLNEEYNEYAKFVTDKSKLDRWYASKYKAINEDIAKEEQASRTALERERRDALTKRLKEVSTAITLQRLRGNTANVEALKLEEEWLRLREKGLDISQDKFESLKAEREISEANLKLQKELNDEYSKGLEHVIDTAIAGGDIGKALQAVGESINSTINDQVSTAITDSLMNGLKTGDFDFGMLDKQGGLTTLGQNAMVTAGNMFAQEAFGGSKNAERGAEYGQMAGTAIGAYFGSPQMGAIVGQMAGGLVGSLLGGSVSYKTTLDEEGNVTASKRTSGGLFSSSKERELAYQTEVLQSEFNRTISTYELLLSRLFDVNTQLEVEAGRYSAGDVVGKFSAGAFIDQILGESISTESLGNLEAFVHERDALLREQNVLGINHNDRLAELNTDIERLLLDTGATLEESITIAGKRANMATEVILRDNIQLSETITQEWKELAEASGEDIRTTLITAFSGLDEVRSNIANSLSSNDPFAEMHRTLDRVRESLGVTTSTLTDATDVTLESFDEYSQRMLASNPSPQMVQNLTNLGNSLLSVESSSTVLQNAIKSLVDSMTASATTLHQALETRGQEGVELAQTMLERATNSYLDSLASLGLDASVSIEELEQTLNSVSHANPDGYDAWIEKNGKLGEEALRNALNLMNAEDALKSAREQGTKAVVSSTYSVNTVTEAVASLIYESSKLKEFTDWKNTFGIDRLGKATYDIETSTDRYRASLNALGLESMTATEYVTQYNKALARGLKQEQVDLWESMGANMKDVVEAQKAYNAILDDQKERLTSFTDWNDLLGLEGLELASAKVEKANKEVMDALSSDWDRLITPSEFIEHYTNAINAGFEGSTVEEWERLGDALKVATEQSMAYRDSIQDTMESLIREEIANIKSLKDTTTSAITNLTKASLELRGGESNVSSSSIYDSISEWSLEANSSIEADIKKWREQQLDAVKKADEAGRQAHSERLKRLQNEENLRVKNHNLSVDAKNAEIRLNNSLRESIVSMQDSVSSTFAGILTTTSDIARGNVYDNINNKDYGDVTSSFSTFASMEMAGTTDRIESLLKLAYVNRDVQSIDAPKEQPLLEHITAGVVDIGEYTSMLDKSTATIDESTAKMYDALIEQNDASLPTLDERLLDLFTQNQHYFDSESDIYKFMYESAMGTKELTFNERMNEQYQLMGEVSELNVLMLDRNFSNLGDISKELGVKTNKNKEDIASLKTDIARLVALKEEANRIANEANRIANETAKNTSTPLVETNISQFMQ